ncbi:MAG: aldo/keto reductase [Pseudomonadota bacterium]|nr:aldo/keto reductase [Pseudomonadota bacterium]
MTKSPYFSSVLQRGFGTWPLKGAVLEAAVEAALEIGYRAFDTAQMYQNEQDLGAALARIGARRDEICLTTKAHPDNVTPDKFLDSVRVSLDALRVERVDVLLLHWPPPDGDVAAAARRLESALAAGLTRAIGVSNFTAAMMRSAAGAIETPLVANQVEFHALIDQNKLLRAANETAIPLVSFCSLARGEILKYPLFAELARDYGRSVSQIALRWILQKGVAINTMSTKRENIQSNFDVMDFVLSSVDMARIDALNAIGFRIVSKDKVPWAPLWD